MTLVSLGFSCQTRLSIDEVTADHRSLPLDFVVATRPAVLEALRTRGASFLPEADALSVFTMPAEGREGPAADGLFFWHDAPMEGAKLAANWRDALPAMRDKYRFLWDRFARILADPARRKRLVLSNTQSNLGEYAPEGGFEAAFGLTADFHAELVAALAAFGAADCEIVFLNRDLGQVLETRARIAEPGFSTRFGGVLALPTHARFAVGALGGLAGEGGWVERACGAYEDGWSVTPSAPGTAIAWRDTGEGPTPAGELTEAPGGLLGVFADAPGHVMRVVEEDGDLYFATGTWGPKLRWRRARR